MDKLFKCIVCDNLTVRRYLGRWVHKSCFDFVVPSIVQEFGVHNRTEVMEKLIIMRNWQGGGFIDIERSRILLDIINQKVETIKES